MTKTSKNNLLENYLNVSEQLVREFVKRYFLDEETDRIEDIEYDMIRLKTFGPGIVNINDYYFSIEDVYVCLNNEIPSEILFEYYDLSVEKEGKPEINLLNYFKLHSK